jgi:hypothetical protein
LNEPRMLVVPETVVWLESAMPVASFPNIAVPKFANGRTRPLLDGASATHSAELRTAVGSVGVWRAAVPVVTSLRDTVNEPLA